MVTGTAELTTVPPLEVSALAMWRGDHCLFESLDFTAEAGRNVLVVGRNGAGKTTLLRVLAGLTPPTSGRVEWGGADIRDLAPERRGAVAYRGHTEGLKRDLTVRENLSFSRRIAENRGDIEAIAAELGLSSKLDVRARHLSAGQRRRVGLGILRLSGATLWILDEPMTHLDAAGRRLVIAWIARHVEDGGMAIVATHQPEELARSGSLMIEL
jgi:heme exporter protein A